MLEIKQGTLVVAKKQVFHQLSFMALERQLTCVGGSAGCGKTALLEVFLGLRPLTDGYVSVAGEQITALSAETFRSMMAYVPQRFAFEGMSVAALCKTLGRHGRSDSVVSLDALMDECRLLALEQIDYRVSLDTLPVDEQQRLLLAFAGVLNRPMVLLDEPTALQSDECTSLVLSYIRQLALRGAAVLLTTADDILARQTDKFIELTHPE